MGRKGRKEKPPETKVAPYKCYGHKDCRKIERKTKQCKECEIVEKFLNKKPYPK